MIVKSVPDHWPTVRTSTRHNACSKNAIPIASSRPVRSDIQPQKMRLPPFASAFKEVAAASAVAGMPHDFAIEPALAVTNSPPVAIITKLA